MRALCPQVTHAGVGYCLGFSFFLFLIAATYTGAASKTKREERKFRERRCDSVVPPWRGAHARRDAAAAAGSAACMTPSALPPLLPAFRRSSSSPAANLASFFVNSGTPVLARNLPAS